MGDIKVDRSGNILLCGARAVNGQTVGSLWQYDAFITKLMPDGQPIFTITLGTSLRNDYANFLGLDADGNVYVSGTTYSPDFPITNAVQSTFAGSDGKADIFVVKLTADGTSLLFSTFLGGTDSDWVTGMAVDESGNVAICGQTFSTNFPRMDCVGDSSAYRSFVALFSTSGEPSVSGPLDLLLMRLPLGRTAI